MAMLQCASALERTHTPTQIESQKWGAEKKSAQRWLNDKIKRAEGKWQFVENVVKKKKMKENCWYLASKCTSS